ncbi:MAG: hypothetical protein AMXMBFR84_39790 [Candidatus Hydrogenedentota bacterium]
MKGECKYSREFNVCMFGLVVLLLAGCRFSNQAETSTGAVRQNHAIHRYAGELLETIALSGTKLDENGARLLIARAPSNRHKQIRDSDLAPTSIQVGRVTFNSDKANIGIKIRVSNVSKEDYELVVADTYIGIPNSSPKDSSRWSKVQQQSNVIVYPGTVVFGVAEEYIDTSAEPSLLAGNEEKTFDIGFDSVLDVPPRFVVTFRQSSIGKLVVFIVECPKYRD